MSEGAWTAIAGVLVGGLLAPALAAAGYWVRRQWEREDRAHEARRQALYALQDALIDLGDARERAMAPADPEAVWALRAEAQGAIRRVRIWAARVGDPQLWAMVHPPPSGEPALPGGRQVAGVFPPPDELDLINGRVRDLLWEAEWSPGAPWWKLAARPRRA